MLSVIHFTRTDDALARAMQRDAWAYAQLWWAHRPTDADVECVCLSRAVYLSSAAAKSLGSN